MTGCLATALWLFTAIAIVIACLGLFGLSLFTIARNKEISDPQSFGSHVIQIVRLITKDFFCGWYSSPARSAAGGHLYWLITGLKIYAFISARPLVFLLPVIIS